MGRRLRVECMGVTSVFRGTCSGFLPVLLVAPLQYLAHSSSSVWALNMGTPQHLAGALFSSLSVVSAQSWGLNATYMLATLQTSIFIPDLSSKLHSRTSNCQTDHSSFMSLKYRRHDLPQTELFISPQTSPSPGFPILVNGTSTCPGFQNKSWEVSLDSPSPTDHDHLSFL